MDGSGVPAANKSHVAIRPVRSSSPKAGSLHIDNEKTVAEGQLLRVHNDSDSDDQVNISLDMSTSSSVKKRREQRKKHTDKHNINLQTLTISSKLRRKIGKKCEGRKRKKVLQMPIISVFPDVPYALRPIIHR